MAATRQIKRKIAELEEQLVQAAPKLAAWSSVQALSSSEVPKLEQLQMSGREIEEAGVSPYSYTDPSEVPARLKLLSTLPQLEQELNQVQVQWELSSPWRFELVLACGAALAAVLSSVPQQVQLGVLASSVVVLGSWLGSCGAALSKQLQLLTELQFGLDLKLAEIQKSQGWAYTALRKVEFSLVYREGNTVKLLLQIFDKLGYCEKRFELHDDVI